MLFRSGRDNLGAFLDFDSGLAGFFASAKDFRATVQFPAVQADLGERLCRFPAFLDLALRRLSRVVDPLGNRFNIGLNLHDQVLDIAG